MTNLLTKQILFSGLTLVACSSIADAEYSCPQKVSVAWQITDPPKGWHVFGDNRDNKHEHYLVSSTFSIGPPEDGGFLKPSEVVKSKNSIPETEVYKFPNIPNQSIWLVCLYGNTPAVVSNKLPDSIKSCKVAHSKDLSNQKVSCK
ncbi:MAG: hypothetical protein OEZ68_18615 [Gammaproteobacteria bacterium]|nr:hypothetical protein [Gammaproteobacteria bacterium]MDH5802820.1 hypothetical protein [Gammaproteobacteria bacterium]